MEHDNVTHQDEDKPNPLSVANNSRPKHSDFGSEEKRRESTGGQRRENDEEEGENGREGRRIHGDEHLPANIQPPEEQYPPETTDLVKVILLGAPAVGKTSIIQQFVWNEFSDIYHPTDRRHTYYPSVVINGRLYDLKISDLPPVPYFPIDSLYEWTDFRSYGLRSATAYVLIFDLSNATETFRHLKCLREQMANSRDMRNVPVVVVGNKHDRLQGPLGVGRSSVSSPFFPTQSSGFGLPGTSSTLPCGSSLSSQIAATYGPSHASSLLLHQQQHQATALAESRERRDIANIVKKHWRCGYVECSAKYNWRVVAVFKELMKAIDSMEGRGNTGLSVLGSLGGSESLVPGVSCGGRSKDSAAGFHLHRPHGGPVVVDNLHDSLDRGKCDVL